MKKPEPFAAPARLDGEKLEASRKGRLGNFPSPDIYDPPADTEEGPAGAPAKTEAKKADPR